MVANRVKWPHEYVLSGVSKERVTYDQLSVTQWVAGFGRIMKEEKNSETKEYMLDYLVALFDDAKDFSWDATKASHAILLCRMEQGEINSYSEVEKIDRVRRANAQRHHSPVCLVIAVKKLVRKIPSPCPVNNITSALVTSSKHTKLGVWFIDIFAQHVLTMGSPSHIQKTNVKIKPKNSQKTSKPECFNLEYSNIYHKNVF